MQSTLFREDPQNLPLDAGWLARRCPRQYSGMIGFLHFAILNDELYVLGPPMPDWVNGLYFLTLAEIQEARFA